MNHLRFLNRGDDTIKSRLLSERCLTDDGLVEATRNPELRLHHLFIRGCQLGDTDQTGRVIFLAKPIQRIAHHLFTA